MSKTTGIYKDSSWSRRTNQSPENKQHGPLARYVKLRVVHPLGLSGTFSLSPTSKETTIYRSRHASQHVRDVPGIPGACGTHNFTYLARSPWQCKNRTQPWQSRGHHRHTNVWDKRTLKWQQETGGERIKQTHTQKTIKQYNWSQTPEPHWMWSNYRQFNVRTHKRTATLAFWMPSL